LLGRLLLLTQSMRSCDGFSVIRVYTWDGYRVGFSCR